MDLRGPITNQVTTASKTLLNSYYGTHVLYIQSGREIQALHSRFDR